MYYSQLSHIVPKKNVNQEALPPQQYPLPTYQKLNPKILNLTRSFNPYPTKLPKQTIQNPFENPKGKPPEGPEEKKTIPITFRKRWRRRGRLKRKKKKKDGKSKKDQHTYMSEGRAWR